MVALAKDLNDLILKYGNSMAVAAESVLKPRFDPRTSKLPDLSVIEKCRTKKSGTPFKFYHSQVEKTAAVLEGLRSYQRAWMVAEPGSGKTVMSLAAIHILMAKKKNWRAIVMCPGHLVRKWRREAQWAIPNVLARVVKNFQELTAWRIAAEAHYGPSVLVISKDAAKLGYDVDKPCASFKYILERGEDTWGINRTTYRKIASCPSCNGIVYDGLGDEKNPMELNEYLSSSASTTCEHCGDKLSTSARGFRSNPHIDRFIQRKMKGFFDVLIADEIHELAGAETMQGNVFGTLAAACRYTIALTGTLIGGHARDLHAPLWRMSPDLVRRRGFDLEPLRGGKIGAIGRNERGFIEQYGVLERQIVRGVEDDHYGRVKRGACGRKKDYKTNVMPRPGISPDLYNHFLIGRAVFMSLSELGPALPSIERVLVGCKPSDDLRQAYQHIDCALETAIKERAQGGKGPPVLSTIRIQVLDEYLDRPWGWGPIYAPIFDENGEKCGTEFIVQPKNFEPMRVDSKDEKIVEICKAELAQGRRCCVYVSFTGKHDARPKIMDVLTKAGLRPVCLPDSVQPVAREDWIAKHLHEIDVMIVQPKRVMTGLDLIQFPSLIWYQVGYSTHVLRQASARARRPTQKQPCKVFFLYYEKLIQEKALGLMGEKEAASQALEGTFDTRALKALMNGGQNDDIMAALAHSLHSHVDARKAWANVDASQNFEHLEPIPIAPELKPEIKMSRKLKREVASGQQFLFSLTDDMEFELPLLADLN